MSEQEGTTAVELRADLVERVEARLPRTEFDSAAAYIDHVLGDVLAHVEATTADDDDAVEAIDEEAVREQLRALGYADE